MKPTSKAYWAVTVGAALELQHQTAKSNTSALIKRHLTTVGSSTQVRIRTGTAAGAGDGPAGDAGSRDEKLKAAEESLRMVVFLSCWGPN